MISSGSSQTIPTRNTMAIETCSQDLSQSSKLLIHVYLSNNFIWWIYYNAEGQFLCTAILALQDRVADWFTFGIHLGVDIHVLNRINRSCLTHIDNHNGIREMLQAWTDKFDREATWDKIVAALRKIGENRLA